MPGSTKPDVSIRARACGAGKVTATASYGPWTAPAPVGAAWALGWDFRAVILVVLLACVSAIIYFPFFKVYEKQLLAQEAEEAQRAAQEGEQVA